MQTHTAAGPQAWPDPGQPLLAAEAATTKPESNGLLDDESLKCTVCFDLCDRPVTVRPGAAQPQETAAASGSTQPEQVWQRACSALWAGPQAVPAAARPRGRCSSTCPGRPATLGACPPASHPAAAAAHASHITVDHTAAFAGAAREQLLVFHPCHKCCLLLQ